MWISKRKYKELLQELHNSKMDTKYWKESFEETYDRYMDCLSYKYGNNKIQKGEQTIKMRSEDEDEKVCTDCEYFVSCECFDGETCSLYDGEQR